MITDLSVPCVLGIKKHEIAICGNGRYEILANPHLRQRDLKKIINSLI